jgi:hypothetical protein
VGRHEDLNVLLFGLLSERLHCPQLPLWVEMGFRLLDQQQFVSLVLLGK